jgi:anti-sigma factor RsiW
MANHLADVASTDRHTVKPWFNGRLDYSPPVADLAAQGYPLVGGRLDYIDRKPVAALIYRHNQHPINLFLWPVANVADQPPSALEKRGYNMLRWAHAGTVYWAVSDVNAADLVAFRELLARAE